MKTLAETIGERLRDLRVAKGMSQAQLAKLCGWSTSSRVANYEIGTRNIGADDAIALARHLDSTPSFIMFGDEENSGQQFPQKQRRLLNLFEQLPEIEQDRMLDLFETRLKEIDEYVENYLRGRFKPAD
ncbi:helix-turn-helix domain-containing protein [Enterobacter soli]|uniref:helix-turn-helix domain-containing protein n=1 Tax=Enterobacter soli TaxID=885040 RepID=UPI002379F846|nr:helix-turn-helix domain-containing protein [Enterobacter soli]MDD9245272.1 helix-turn-helix domain-containing protein [Enterobacter soli]